MAGAHAAMFTPFDKKGRVNGDAIDALIEHGLRGGLKGFYLTGSTGEGMLLTDEERARGQGGKGALEADCTGRLRPD